MTIFFFHQKISLIFFFSGDATVDIKSKVNKSSFILKTPFYANLYREVYEINAQFNQAYVEVSNIHFLKNLFPFILTTNK